MPTIWRVGTHSPLFKYPTPAQRFGLHLALPSSMLISLRRYWCVGCAHLHRPTHVSESVEKFYLWAEISEITTRLSGIQLTKSRGWWKYRSSNSGDTRSRNSYQKLAWKIWRMFVTFSCTTSKQQLAGQSCCMVRVTCQQCWGRVNSNEFNSRVNSFTVSYEFELTHSINRELWFWFNSYFVWVLS